MRLTREFGSKAEIRHRGHGAEIARKLAPCELALEEKMKTAGKKKTAPLKLYDQESTPSIWAMASMDMIRFDRRSDLLAPYKVAHYPLCAIKTV